MSLTKQSVSRTYSGDILTPIQLSAMNTVANHCSHRAQSGLQNWLHLDHPDPMVRFAADMGMREGTFLLNEALAKIGCDPARRTQVAQPNE